MEYELVVEKEGYQPINDKIRLSAGENARRFDFKLAKAAPEGAGDFAKGVEAYNKGDNAGAAAAFEAAMAEGAGPAGDPRQPRAGVLQAAADR